MAAKQATPELRFPEFDEAWEVSSIDEIASFRRGTFPQPYGLKKWYDDENGFPFIQVFDVGDDLRLKKKTKRQISDLAKDQSVFVPKGSIVLTIQGSIGRIAVTQYDACCDRTLLIFTGFKVPLAEMYFVYALFLRFEIEKKIAVGGTIKTITKEKLRVFPIPLPTLPEQRKIADFLTAVDGRIGQLIQKKALLVDYKKGVMQQLFTQAIRFKDDHGNDFPDWEEKKVDEMFNVTRGKVLAMPETRSERSDEFPYPVYSSQTKANGLAGFYEKYLFENAITWTTDGANAGDVKFRAGAFYCTNVCGVLLSEKGYANEFVASMLGTVTRKHVSYVGNPKLMNNVMSKISISVPSSIAEQTKIADSISAIDRKIESVTNQITETQTFKKGLLQQMFV